MSVWNKVYKIIDSELQKRVDSHQTFSPEPLDKALKSDGYGRKGLVFDPFNDQGYAGGLYKPKGAGSGFISNLILKIVSRRDPIVSTILHTRATEVSACCRRQTNRFDMGAKVMTRDKTIVAIPEEIREIEDFIFSTGRTENRAREDFLTFEQFGYMVAWDMLVYGHAAIEKVADLSGGLFAFLPLPAESIYYANKKLMDREVIRSTIGSFKEAYNQTNGNKTPTVETNSAEDFEFVQVINGKIVEGFTNDELILARIYTQSEVDLNGYAISPLERAISMITAHLQIENHQRMFFTHGVASKGLLVIQGDVTPNQLRTLQSQWTNQVTGSNSAWRTPILAGIKGVQWEPLTLGNRDMEYAAYQDHLIRSMHASFAIDPEETGYGYLSKGAEQRNLSESSNEWKLGASRERGLRPLLTRLEAIINEDILPSWRPDYAEKYQFCFVGLDAETRTEEISRLQSEVQLHTTLDEARKEADLDKLPYGGGLILNALLLQTLQSNMPKGLFMEKFMNIEGAASRPDLQYIPDSMWFQWQQVQQQLLQQQAQAQTTLAQEPPEKGKPEKTGQSPEQAAKAKVDEEHAQALDEHESQQSQAQAQLSAIEQFIQANPEIFKSMTERLAKADAPAPTAVNAEVEKMRSKLVKDFEKGAKVFIKDVLEALNEDIQEREEGEPLKPAA